MNFVSHVLVHIHQLCGPPRPRIELNQVNAGSDGLRSSGGCLLVVHDFQDIITCIHLQPHKGFLLPLQMLFGAARVEPATRHLLRHATVADMTANVPK